MKEENVRVGGERREEGEGGGSVWLYLSIELCPCLVVSVRQTHRQLLFFCLALSRFKYVIQRVDQSVLPVCLSVCMPACIHAFLSVYLSSCLSSCLSTLSPCSFSCLSGARCLSVWGGWV